MRKFIGAAILAAMLLTGAPALKAQVSVGIGIGAPPPPRVLRVRPVAPDPGYIWVDGYWYPVDGRYVWHAGYWTLPPYGGALWVGPRWEGGRYYTVTGMETAGASNMITAGIATETETAIAGATMTAIVTKDNWK